MTEITVNQLVNKMTVVYQHYLQENQTDVRFFGNFQYNGTQLFPSHSLKYAENVELDSYLIVDFLFLH